MSLYANINKRKKAGTSRSKGDSTITKKNYDNMKKGFKKKGGFPDMNNDGKTTQADIFLKKKENGTIKKKGGMMKYQTGGSSVKIKGVSLKPTKKTVFPGDRTPSKEEIKAGKRLPVNSELNAALDLGYSSVADHKKANDMSKPKTHPANKTSSVIKKSTKKTEKSYKKLGGFRDNFLEPGVPNLDDL